MKIQNNEVIIEIGSSKIRLGIFDKSISKQNLYFEENIPTNLISKNLDLKNYIELIQKIIRDGEKKINYHIKDISILFDTTEIFSIDFCIRKIVDEKIIQCQDIGYLLEEAENLISSNYKNLKILHLITSKLYFDEKEYNEIPKEKISCNKLTIEIKCIFISLNLFNQLFESFRKISLRVKNFYCSSYVRSMDYKNLFDSYNNKIFLDIGYQKSTLLIYQKEILLNISNLRLGGNHITKDISKILKIDEKIAEKIKLNLSDKNIVFSENSVKENLSNIKFEEKIVDSLDKNLLINLIYARIDEILKLIFKENLNFINILEKSNSILIFIGEGSKILNKNSLYLSDEFHYLNQINHFNESIDNICMSGYRFIANKKNSSENLFIKKSKKTGFFEKLFNYFN